MSPHWFTGGEPANEPGTKRTVQIAEDTPELLLTPTTPTLTWTPTLVSHWGQRVNTENKVTTAPPTDASA